MYKEERILDLLELRKSPGFLFNGLPIIKPKWARWKFELFSSFIFTECQLRAGPWEKNMNKQIGMLSSESPCLSPAPCCRCAGTVHPERLNPRSRSHLAAEARPREHWPPGSVLNALLLPLQCDFRKFLVCVRRGSLSPQRDTALYSIKVCATKGNSRPLKVNYWGCGLDAICSPRRWHGCWRVSPSALVLRGGSGPFKRWSLVEVVGDGALERSRTLPSPSSEFLEKSAGGKSKATLPCCPVPALSHLPQGVTQPEDSEQSWHCAMWTPVFITASQTHLFLKIKQQLQVFPYSNWRETDTAWDG